MKICRVVRAIAVGEKVNIVYRVQPDEPSQVSEDIARVSQRIREYRSCGAACEVLHVRQVVRREQQAEFAGTLAIRNAVDVHPGVECTQGINKVMPKEGMRLLPA